MKTVKIISILALIIGCGLLASRQYHRPISNEIEIDWVVFPFWKGMHGDDRLNEIARFEKLHGRKPNPMEGRQFTHFDWPRAQADEFCRQNPGVRIRIEMLDWANGLQKLEIRAAAASMPDVFYYGDATIGSKFARYGLLEPIENYLTDGDLKDPVYAEAVKFGSRTSTHTWMWPWMRISNFWVVNKRIFEDRGCVDLLPQDSDHTWTYDQFLRAMKAVTYDRQTSKGRIHVYGCAFDFTSYADYNISPFLWGRGARYSDDEGQRVTINSPEGVQGLDFLKSLQDVHRVMPRMGAGQPNDLFLDGRAVLVAADARLLAIIRQAIEEGRLQKDAIKLYPVMPASDSLHRPQSYNSTTGFFVSKQKDPRKRDMIMKFCRFLTSGDNARAVKALTVLPVRQQAMDVYRNDEYRDYYEYSGRVFKYAAPDTRDQYYYYLRQFTMPMLQSVMSGDKTPQQAADECALRGTEFLEAERRRLRVDR